MRTAAGEVREEVLPDGSHVLLSPGSEVRVRIDAQRRQLQLQHGQAWFKVAADAQHPFQVHTRTARSPRSARPSTLPCTTMTAWSPSPSIASAWTAASTASRPPKGNSCASMAGLPSGPWRPAPVPWTGANAACTGSPRPWPRSPRTWIAGMAATPGSSAHTCASSRSPCSAAPTVRAQPRPAGHAAAGARAPPGVQVWLPPRKGHRDAP